MGVLSVAHPCFDDLEPISSGDVRNVRSRRRLSYQPILVQKRAGYLAFLLSRRNSCFSKLLFAKTAGRSQANLFSRKYCLLRVDDNNAWVLDGSKARLRSLPVPVCLLRSSKGSALETVAVTGNSEFQCLLTAVSIARTSRTLHQPPSGNLLDAGNKSSISVFCDACVDSGLLSNLHIYREAIYDTWDTWQREKTPSKRLGFEGT